MNIRDKNFVDQISQHELLTPKEEKALGITICNCKNGKKRDEAIEKLIRCNQRLVIDWAHYYHKRFADIPFVDLIGSGNVGLAVVSERFDPVEHDNRFAAYAVPYIRLHMRFLINKSVHHVHVPAYILDKIPLYNSIMNDENNIGLSDKEIGKMLDVTDRVLHNIKKSQANVLHFDKEIENDGNVTLSDIIEDPDAISPEYSISQNSTFDALWAAVDKLNDIQKAIIVGQYLSQDKQTLEELGRHFKLSGERIRQIKEEAKTRLKSLLKIEGITFNLVR